MRKNISVALATYKGAKYLPELLQSLAAQSYLPFELVVSDDNSPDDTLSIVDSFAETAPFRVRVVRNTEQLGIIKNFAKAFENTTGELIAYCDQDDIWDKEKLEKCVHYFSDPTVKLVMHRSQVVNGKLEPLGYFTPERHETEFGRVRFPSSADMSYGLGHQMVFDARIYRDYAWIFQQGFDELKPIAENYDTQFRFLAGINGDIISLDDALVKFRRHENATSDAGLVDGDTATTSGFLSKSSRYYLDESDDLLAIAVLFEHKIVDKMDRQKENLHAYVTFLQERSSLFAQRAKIYQGQSLTVRVGTYFSLLGKWAYRRKSHKGFGRKALIVDAVIAICGLDRTQKMVARLRG